MSPLTEEEKAVAAQAERLIASNIEELEKLAGILPKHKRQILKKDGKTVAQEVENDSYVTSRIREVLHDYTRVAKFWKEWFDESRWGLK